jgi:hypothetical protein
MMDDAIPEEIYKLCNFDKILLDFIYKKLKFLSKNFSKGLKLFLVTNY